MIHLHLTSIFIAAILYVVALILYKKDPAKENKGAKITHMILRVIYLLVIFSGLMVYIGNMEIISALNEHMLYGIKVLCGIVAVALMEMSLIKVRKQNGKGGMWLVITIVLIVATFLLGAYLPLGTMAF